MNRLTSIARYEQTIRHSRFIGVCGPITSETEAREFIARHGEKSCSHVCHAWRLGERVHTDDAGEPGGTAGRPILAAIDHFQLDGAIVVVSRHFGGVKLGTGGLVRAYGGTAMQTLSLASIEAIVERRRIRLNVPFQAARDVHLLAERHDAIKLDEQWTDQALSLMLALPVDRVDDFVAQFNRLTRGAGQFIEVKE
ncbi:MAG: IMPACT family protein [Wenzhouxiangellaceae bacterium]